MRDDEKIEHMLDVIKDEILPLTECEVKRGNHVFGGAILRPDTMTSVMVGSNNRVENPLFHGEIDTIIRFFKLPVHSRADELIFLSSHDPCPMCIAAIAWAGFKEVWYLFDYKDIAEKFGMPADLEMYKEVFGTKGVRAENKFFRKYSIKEAIAGLPDPERFAPAMEEIEKRYAALKVADFGYPGSPDTDA
ncbi:MAG: nucleoside deaminase [Synergistaceae bacterium]|jgi:tRNA(Arg) A34 adenosine deaminase TadA|nr:nucleoside deaminase [Synergistaceae bacterium]